MPDENKLDEKIDPGGEVDVEDEDAPEGDDLLIDWIDRGEYELL